MSDKQAVMDLQKQLEQLQGKCIMLEEVARRAFAVYCLDKETIEKLKAELAKAHEQLKVYQTPCITKVVQ